MTDTPTPPAPPHPLTWGHDSADVSTGGITAKLSASPAERAAVAAALEILACEALTVRYTLKRAPADGYRLRGKLDADVVQACVVTLAPVHGTVSAAFDVEFRPAEDAAAAAGGLVDLDEDTEIEPIEGSWLAVGRVVYEELAAGLDPYPRRPGAEFTPPADANQSAVKEHPFAVLAKLKRPSTDAG